MKFMNLVKKFGSSNLTKKATALSVTAASVITTMSLTMASATTGDADLDVLLGDMTSGLSTVKTGGLIIVGGVIAIAVVFLGARWLWNMFRSWLSRAQ